MAMDTQVVDAEQLIVQHLDLWTSAQTAKSTAGRGSNNKIELTGIKKLRELILELAVRGKLVPQDPNDEPASELLKLIAKVKAASGKSLKSKNTIAFTSDHETGDSAELPLNWGRATLSDIAEINPRNQAEDEVDVSFVPMALISNSFNGEHSFEERKWRDIKQGFTHFADGDIGVAKITPCFENSKAAIFSGLKNGIGAGTTELHIARPYTSLVSPNFILLNLKSPKFLKIGESKMTGTAGQKRLPKDFFGDFVLMIPPLKEQDRIISKFTELMALCDQLEQQSYQSIDAHNQLVDTLLQTLVDSANADELASNWQRLSEHFDSLFTTEYSIDALKQTILQLAVMGRLVKQDPTDEPASELLKRIANEKEALVKAGKIKKQKPLPPITDAEKPFELSEGWYFSRIGELAELFSGKGFKAEEYSSAGARLFQIANVSLGCTKWDVENFLPIEYLDIYPNLKLKAGDVLIALNRPLLNMKMKVCVISENDLPAILYQRVGKFSFYDEHLLTEYFYIYLQSLMFINKLNEDLQGSDQPFINQSQVIKFIVPIAPLAEQKRIVSKVHDLMRICDDLSNQLFSKQIIQTKLSEALIQEAAI